MKKISLILAVALAAAADMQAQNFVTATRNLRITVDNPAYAVRLLPTAHNVACKDDSTAPGAKLKTLTITVTERGSGKRVANVEKENLIIYEENARREIALFSRLDAPVKVFLLIDTSPSIGTRLKDLTNAANVFIEQLKPGDALSVISFDGTIK